mgnify:CR=1 FL=1
MSTRAVAHDSATEQPVAEAQWLLRIGGTLLLVTLSALAVVYTTFTNRQMFIELQTLERWERETQVELGKLLIEESTWSSPALVEQQAREQLSMQAPKTKQWLVVSDGARD